MPTVAVLVASPLEPRHVERIAAVDPRVEVMYRPDLLPVPRYAADHVGVPRDLTPEQLEEWRALLARAEVSFDFDWWAPGDMRRNAPRLRWVQATSAGIGQFVQRTGLVETDLVFTTAAGVHAVPLAEFALAGVLEFVKGLADLRRWQAKRHWERYTTRRLAGSRVVVLGLGGVGREVARVFAALGCEVVGVGRPGRGYDVPGLERVVPFTELDSALAGTTALILACPLTDVTRRCIGERQLRLLPPGAVLVNIARGPVVDEPALVDALRDGHLGGAALDVFATEPLPAESPLWGLDNVIVSPHSASTVETENATITDLFRDNLRRWLDGRPLRNEFSRENGY
jgi:phosphoglycerate dehydrogenase-like enzyme